MFTPLFTENPYPLLIICPESLEILKVNRSAVETYGFAEKELLSKSIYDLQPNQEPATIFKNQLNVREGFDSLGMTYHQNKLGEVFSAKIFSYTINFKDHERCLLKILPLDSKAENLPLVDETEEHLKYHLANSPLAYGVWDGSFQLQKFSPKITEWLGYSEEELLGKDSTYLAFQYVADSDFSKVKQEIDAILSGKQTNSQIELEVTAKNGEPKYLKFYNSVLKNSNGELISLLTLIENQTELFKNKQVKQRQREVIENTSDFIGLVDTIGNIDYINPAGKKMLGLPKDRDVSNDNIKDYHSDFTLRYLEDKVFPAAKEHGLWEGELSFKKNDATEILIDAVIASHKDSAGKVEYFSMISRDISKEKKVLNDLRSERQKLELAMHGGDVGFWQYFPIREQLDTDHEWLAEKLGYEKSTLKNKELWLEIIHPDDLSRILENFTQLTTGKKNIFAEELQVKRSDGSYIWILSKAKVVERNSRGQVKKISGIHLDINDEKRTEEKFRYIAENAQDKIAIYDAKANCSYASPSTESLLGYSVSEFMNQKLLDFIHPDDQQVFKNNIQDLRKGNGKNRISYRYKHKNGHYIWLESRLKPVYENSNLKEVYAVTRDISDQKKYQQKLEAGNQFIEKAIDSLPGLFYVLDSDFNYVKVNKNFERELGYTKEDLDKMNPLDLYYEEDYERISQEIQKAFAGEEAMAVAKLKKKDGTDGWYHLTGTRFQQDEKNYILGTGIDISPRIHAEEDLKRKSDLLFNLFNNAPVGIAMVDFQNVVVDVNHSFKEMFGYEKEEVLRKDVNDLITPEEYKGEQTKVFHKQREGTDSFQYESVRVKKDGTKIPVLVGSVPIVVNDNSTVSYLIYVDITERKAYLEEIKKSLEEKKVLLQEIHHRVKNNLAIVSSLLQLQKFNTDNKQLTKALTESEMRIQTMAMIHEQLYGVKSLSQIPMKSYIRKLSNSVKKIYDPKGYINLAIESDRFSLNVNQAIPCALIINEILSNAFEHAFEETNGQIDLEITEKSGQIRLTIRDNGKGLPKNFKLVDVQSLGYLVVQTLVKQLEAEIEIGGNFGTTVTLLFDKENSKGSSSLLQEFK